jgi:hypothetical protein
LPTPRRTLPCRSSSKLTLRVLEKNSHELVCDTSLEESKSFTFHTVSVSLARAQRSVIYENAELLRAFCPRLDRHACFH